MALQNPASWLFATGVGLLAFGLYEVGDAFLSDPTAWGTVAFGAVQVVAGAVLTPVGLRVWAHRR